MSIAVNKDFLRYLETLMSPHPMLFTEATFDKMQMKASVVFFQLGLSSFRVLLTEYF